MLYNKKYLIKAKVNIVKYRTRIYKMIIWLMKMIIWTICDTYYEIYLDFKLINTAYTNTKW